MSSLEPNIFNTLGKTHEEQSAICLKSIAISLKRIADQLEKQEISVMSTTKRKSS